MRILFKIILVGILLAVAIPSSTCATQTDYANATSVAYAYGHPVACEECVKWVYVDSNIRVTLYEEDNGTRIIVRWRGEIVAKWINKPIEKVWLERRFKPGDWQGYLARLLF